MPLGFGAIGQYALAETPSSGLVVVGGILTITSDDVLQLPINCVLMGNQPYEKSGKTADLPHDKNVKLKPRFMRSGLRKL